MTSTRNDRSAPMSLEDEYRRIRDHHRAAIKSTVVRMSLPGSITRVFEKNTKADLAEALESIPVDALPDITNDDEFSVWFEAQRAVLAEAIRKRNASGASARVHAGNEWGHAPKILAVFLHNLVSFSRYFTDAQARSIEPLLTCPIDGLNLDRLRLVGEREFASSIRDIASADDQRAIQQRLLEVAQRVGVPRVWFDDNWGSRVEAETEDDR